MHKLVLTVEEYLAGSDVQDAVFAESTRRCDSLRGISAVLPTYSLMKIGMKQTVEKRTKNVERVGLNNTANSLRGHRDTQRNPGIRSRAGGSAGPTALPVMISSPKWIAVRIRAHLRVHLTLLLCSIAHTARRCTETLERYAYPSPTTSLR
jgi:hypothetical protein